MATNKTRSFELVTPPPQLQKAFNDFMEFESKLLDIAEIDTGGDTLMNEIADGIFLIDPNDAKDPNLDPAECRSNNDIGEMFEMIGRLHYKCNYDRYFYLKHNEVMYLFAAYNADTTTSKINEARKNCAMCFAEEMLKKHSEKEPAKEVASLKPVFGGGMKETTTSAPAPASNGSTQGEVEGTLPNRARSELVLKRAAEIEKVVCEGNPSVIVDALNQFQGSYAVEYLLQAYTERCSFSLDELLSDIRKAR